MQYRWNQYICINISIMWNLCSSFANLLFVEGVNKLQRTAWDFQNRNPDVVTTVYNISRITIFVKDADYVPKCCDQRSFLSTACLPVQNLRERQQKQDNRNCYVEYVKNWLDSFLNDLLE